MSVPEIPLAAETLVIADLHLRVEDPASLDPFLAWLGDLGPRPRLVILGDLFEYWVGPAQADGPGARACTDALAALVQRGTRVDIVPGNRDFLLDPVFERRSGACVRHTDLLGVTEAGQRVLFLHGDELCTEDRGHQRLRRVLRAPLTRWIAYHVPFWVGRTVAERLRRISRRSAQRKDMGTVQMMPEACRAAAQGAGADVVVCGHAHRHRDERLGDGPRWLVLDDFGGARDALRLDGDGRLLPEQSGASYPAPPGAA